MTLVAELDVEVGLGRARSEGVPAGAAHRCGSVGGVDVCLHGCSILGALERASGDNKELWPWYSFPQLPWRRCCRTGSGAFESPDFPALRRPREYRSTNSTASKRNCGHCSPDSLTPSNRPR